MTNPETRNRRTIPNGAVIVSLFLLLLILLVGGGNLWATYSYVKQFKAQQKSSGQQLEDKLCGTLGGLSLDKPPLLLPTSVQWASLVNPGRSYDERLYIKLSSLGTDINCPHH